MKARLLLTVSAMLILASCGGGSQSAAKTTAVPVVLTCAAGGTCVVGDTGPGGGIVFYVAATSFACGATLASSCTYLEAAPSGWFVSPASGCEAAESLDVDPICVWTELAYGDTFTSTTGTAIGTGYKNTTEIITQLGAEVAPAVVSQAYRGGGLSDWFLPSKDELNELCKYARNQTTGDTLTICDNTGTLRSGFSVYDPSGYKGHNRWSSSDIDSNLAWAQYFGQIDRNDSGVQVDSSKNNDHYVRPVRAF